MIILIEGGPIYGNKKFINKLRRGMFLYLLVALRFSIYSFGHF